MCMVMIQEVKPKITKERIYQLFFTLRNIPREELVEYLKCTDKELMRIYEEYSNGCPTE